MSSPDELYKEAIGAFGPALERLARGYEADAEMRRDLLQEIHIALWRSFSGFDGRCSLRTWVYRVAHNRAVSYVRTSRFRNERSIVTDSEIEAPASHEDRELELDRAQAQERLLSLIRQLPPLNRQIICLHLEGMDAASIAEIVGLSASHVHTKVHRLKEALVEDVRKGKRHVR
jgi:RNA polymerase sigma-70 factor (ECF subfamily)